MPAKFGRDILADSTGVRVACKLVKTVDGTDDAGLIAADMTAMFYRAAAASGVSITLSDATGLDDAHGSGKIKETPISAVYQLHLPDAAVATGADWVVVRLESADSYYDELIRIGDNQVVLEAVTHAGATIPTVSTLTGHTAQTGDSYARIGATGSGLTSLAPASTALTNATWTDTKAGYLDAAISGVPDAGAIQSAATAAMNAYDPPTKAELDAGLAGLSIPTAAAIADAVWEEPWADHVADATVGGLIRPYDATCQAGSGASSIVLAATASAVDDTYNGQEVLVVTGTGAGQARRITDYVGATRTATVDSAWTTTPDDTSGYRIGGVVVSDSGLTDASIADAVWDEARSGHVASGSFGEHIDAAISSRMATYAQPTGFLAATFPTTVASTTNITAATGVVLGATGLDAVLIGSLTFPAVTTKMAAVLLGVESAPDATTRAYAMADDAGTLAVSATINATTGIRTAVDLDP